MYLVEKKKHSTREIFVTGHMLFLMKSTQVGILSEGYLSEIKTHITKELIIIGYKKKTFFNNRQCCTFGINLGCCVFLNK
jgi:hypothetical protein